MELTCLEHVESQAPKSGARRGSEEMTTTQVRGRDAGTSQLQAGAHGLSSWLWHRGQCVGAKWRTVVLRHVSTWKVNRTSQNPSSICFHSGLATAAGILDEKAAGGGAGQVLMPRAPPAACRLFRCRWPACCQPEPVAFGGLCSLYLMSHFPHLPVLGLKAQQMQKEVQRRD